MPFLENLGNIDETTLPSGLRCGWKNFECAESIKRIKERVSTKQPLQATPQ